MQTLNNILVIELSEDYTISMVGVTLSDLGARVIKIETKESLENTRKLALENLFIDSSSLLFHEQNTGKESYSINLSKKEDLSALKKLIYKADIFIHSFKAKRIKKYGLNYDEIKKKNPKIIYSTIVGCSEKGPLSKISNQDLMAQSLSGLTYISGNKDNPPIPMGLPIVRSFANVNLTQGILAALYYREKTKHGLKINVSLLESAVDIQFELITTTLKNKKLPIRAKNGNAHVDLPAPYGVYKTKNSYIAISTIPINILSKMMNFEVPPEFVPRSAWFDKRDEIMDFLTPKFLDKTTKEWLDILEPADLWCSSMNDYNNILNEDAYKILNMNQEIKTKEGTTFTTTRIPFRIDGEYIYSKKSISEFGNDNVKIDQEFGLNEI